MMGPPHQAENGTTHPLYANSFVIGVAGGTASGKTTVCDYIMQRLREQCVVILSQDSFYRGLTEKELQNVQGRWPILDSPYRSLARRL